MNVVALTVGVVALALCLWRWLRVAQAEHYLAGSGYAVLRRWLVTRPNNVIVIGVAAGGALTTVVAGGDDALPSVAAVVAGVTAVAVPFWLPVFGRTKKLVWTRRLRTLAVTSAVLAVVIIVVGALVDRLVAMPAVLAVVAWALVDLGLRVTAPIERASTERFRRQAQQRLEQIRPRTIAITGSFGKTSTKQHVRDLVSDTFNVYATPASWNNVAGLSRAINEQLSPGTEVFVAEMGTYGVGEIAAMVEWVKPEVAVLTSIGPMHLERMRTLETIAKAKSEIFAGARVGVLCVDDERVASIADGLATAEVWRCGTRGQPGLDVEVTTHDGDHVVRARGEQIGTYPAGAGLHAGNVACAVAAALAIGVPARQIGPRLAHLAPGAHRATAETNDAGVVVVDDTFNSNPFGAEAAVANLVRLVPDGRRRVVVTPGMVELGSLQAEANRRFAARCVEEGCTLVVVGWTNRADLLAGANAGDVVVVPSRDSARDWLRTHLGTGDGVLWENDLPDHYP